MQHQEKSYMWEWVVTKHYYRNLKSSSVTQETMGCIQNVGCANTILLLIEQSCLALPFLLYLPELLKLLLLEEREPQQQHERGGVFDKLGK